MTSRLLAARITGRSVAAAIYYGRDLHYTEVRQLASDIDQATSSLVAFLSSLIQHFHIDSATVEESTDDFRAGAMTVEMIDLLREKGISCWTVEQSAILEAYGEVPLKSIRELRGVVSNYWPRVIDEQESRTCLDAAALGLYFQTERMLSNHSSATP